MNFPMPQLIAREFTRGLSRWLMMATGQIFENERKALCDAYEQARVFPAPATTCVMNEGTPVAWLG